MSGTRVDDLSLAECLAYDPQPYRSVGRIRFRCPRHGGDRQKSLVVDEETGKFRCWNGGCGIWGTLTENRTGTADPGWGRPPSGWRGPVTLPLLLQPEPLAPNAHAIERAVAAWKRFADSPAQTYARQRGISDNAARSLRLGYWKGGWQGEDSEWLTFPLRCPVNGRPVGVYGRNLHSDDQARKARVLGPRGLFGSAQPEPLPDELILVEGAFEAFAILQSPGLPPARAVIGASARAEWFDHCRRVIILFDDDPPGREATTRLVDALNARRLRRNAGPRVLCLRPEALAQQHGCKDLGELLQRGVRVSLDLTPLPSALGEPAPPRVTAPPAWNADHALEWIRAAWVDLGQRAPEGTLSWCEQHHPGLSTALEAAEIDLNAAYDAEDPEAFSLALVSFSAAVGALAAARAEPSEGD